jgi:hypothetical protein
VSLLLARLSSQAKQWTASAPNNNLSSVKTTQATGWSTSQRLSVSAYEIFSISVISQSVEVIKLSKSISL